MLNKFEALKYFCTACETLNFRETAKRLNVSPSVITRVVNELEQELGEPLFVRHTRSIQLTDFGEQFWQRATRILIESENLFQMGRKPENDLAGVVRITVPSWRDNDVILQQLLTTLEPYPNIVLDWRDNMSLLDDVANKIDIGFRVGLSVEENFIMREIGWLGDVLVASPKLVEKLGKPKDFDDFQRRFPCCVPINVNTGKPWDLILNENTTLNPVNIAFYSADGYSALQAILLGKGAGLVNDFVAKPYLQTGELVQLLPEIAIDKWRLYLYRPYRSITPKRVLKVFDLLTDILKGYFHNA